MSDRPTGANGKRSQAWGTTTACPACGQCLCFGCHPSGPCLDEQDEGGSGRRVGDSLRRSFEMWQAGSPATGGEATRLS